MGLRRRFSISFVPQAQKPAPKTKHTAHKPLPYSPQSRVPTLFQKPLETGSSSSSITGWRKVGLIGMCISGCVITAYIASLVISWSRDSDSNSSKQIPADVSDRYDLIASKFDASVDSMEKSIGIMKLRKQMAAEASGDVCEVSIGTGRNLSFYDWNFKGFNGVGKPGSGRTIKVGKVKSFTAIDKSEEMLEIAHEKFSAAYPGILGVRWVIQDATKPLPGPPVSANERSGNKAGKKYDTILQTMGLCSTPDPAGLLKNLAASVEPDGRILLLEHGRSSWNMVNKLLDASASKHADEFGCWWNKDIEQIIKDSGLEVVELRRKHFGTTYWIELKPSQTGLEALKATQDQQVSRTHTKPEFEAAAATTETPSGSAEKISAKTRWF